jgi:hypothetical protein
MLCLAITDTALNGLLLGGPVVPDDLLDLMLLSRFG